MFTPEGKLLIITSQVTHSEERQSLARASSIAHKINSTLHLHRNLKFYVKYCTVECQWFSPRSFRVRLHTQHQITDTHIVRAAVCCERHLQQSSKLTSNMCNAPATSQRLVNAVLRGSKRYVRPALSSLRTSSTKASMRAAQQVVLDYSTHASKPQHWLTHCYRWAHPYIHPNPKLLVDVSSVFCFVPFCFFCFWSKVDSRLHHFLWLNHMSQPPPLTLQTCVQDI